MPFIVSLKKTSRFIDMQYDEGFFPRRFHYRKDAEHLAEEVRKLMGEAEIKLVTKPGEALLKVSRKHRG
jgi:hypothetical protein